MVRFTISTITEAHWERIRGARLDRQADRLGGHHSHPGEAARWSEPGPRQGDEGKCEIGATLGL